MSPHGDIKSSLRKRVVTSAACEPKLGVVPITLHMIQLWELLFMRSSLLTILATAGLALFATMPSFADNPGHHPAYLHALSDLRAARAHLQHFSSDPVDHAEGKAIENIDKAINEIKRAAIMDGKNIDDHMPVDEHLDRSGRYHRALELLDKAQQDVSGEEDQPDTQGLQLRVMGHIDAARRDVHHAIDMYFHG
jgi:hypothetical protein